MSIVAWILVGLVGAGYFIYDFFFKGGGPSDYNFETSVVDHQITPRKTVEKEEFKDTDADGVERDGGIYKVKSFVLGNGEKIMVHSEDNAVPHGVETGENDEIEKDKIESELASKNFFTGFLDNLTQIQRGGGTDIFGLLRKIPGPIYFLVLVVIIVFLG